MGCNPCVRPFLLVLTASFPVFPCISYKPWHNAEHRSLLCSSPVVPLVLETLPPSPAYLKDPAEGLAPSRCSNTAGLSEQSVSILLAPPPVGRSRTWEVGNPHQRSTAPRETHPALDTNFLHVLVGLDMKCDGDVPATPSPSGSNISVFKNTVRFLCP